LVTIAAWQTLPGARPNRGAFFDLHRSKRDQLDLAPG
jgi:hypothetical protein